MHHLTVLKGVMRRCFIFKVGLWKFEFWFTIFDLANLNGMLSAQKKQEVSCGGTDKALDTGSCLRLTEKVALHIGYENLHLKLFYIFNECIYRPGLPPIQGIAHTEIKMLLIFARPHVTRHEVNTRDVCRVFALSHESSFPCYFPFSCSRLEIDVCIQVWRIKIQAWIKFGELDKRIFSC